MLVFDNGYLIQILIFLLLILSWGLLVLRFWCGVDVLFWCGYFVLILMLSRCWFPFLGLCDLVAAGLPLCYIVTLLRMVLISLILWQFLEFTASSGIVSLLSLTGWKFLGQAGPRGSRSPLLSRIRGGFLDSAVNTPCYIYFTLRL